MTVAMATVLLPDQGHQGCGELVFPSFCLNQTSFTLNELIRRPTATWALCLFWAGLSVLLDLRGNWETLFITKRDWSQSVAMVMTYSAPPCTLLKGYYSCQVWIISLLHFERYSWFCYPSSSGTTDDVLNLLICITQKLKYVWNEKRYFKTVMTIIHYFENSFK